MVHRLVRSFILILCGVASLATDLLALDTLRVGNNGNVAWTGAVSGAAVNTAPPEYKVNRFSTEIGNVPGNLIDLANLDVTSPRVLVKTLVEAPPELLAGEVALVEERLLEVISTLPGVTASEPATREGLSTIRVDFADDIPLAEAVARVTAAIDAIRPAPELDQVPVDEVAAGKLLLQDPGRLPPDVDPVILPIALNPDHVAKGENVALRALGWGGGITAPAIKDVPASELETTLLELIEPGGAEDAFARKGAFGALGTFIVLDLGSPIGINRIRFYPRNTVQSAPQYPFQIDFIRQFELLVHDGQNLVLDGTGRLVPQLDDFELLQRTTTNEDAVVEVALDPAQTARFVRLKSTSSFPYEIDEFEVFGQGFISSSRYISHVYDLGSPATWGNLNWIEQTVDLRAGGGLADRFGATDNCQVNIQVFIAAGDIPDTWGDCGTVARFVEDLGYINVWECFQTQCPQADGTVNMQSGRREIGKPIALKPLADGLSQVFVRTRTGTDPTPVLYKRSNVQRVSDDQQSTSLANPEQQLGRDEYLNLVPNLETTPPQVWDMGEIDEDPQNWSPWSSPYRGGERAGGAPVLSPGPRRYIQFSVDFLNAEINATKILEQLSIEYLLPPIAEELVAEIFPREVEVFESVDFTYAVRAKMEFAGVKGFDTFELLTTSRVLGIDKIEIWEMPGRLVTEQALNADVVTDPNGQAAVQTPDGNRHALPYTVEAEAGEAFTIQAVTERNVIVRFPQITRPQGGGQMLLKIKFRGRVLLFSTLFRGQAVLSSQTGSIQRISAGNADFLGAGDLPTASGITVLSPDINKGDLFSSFVVTPPVFTPNGDDINETAEVGYDILAVTRPTDVAVKIFDLSGRLVKSLYTGSDLSGHYDARAVPQLSWDGRDKAGNRVPPGLYLVALSVDGDARKTRRVRTLGVAY
ncbi:MAG: hypothetical protein VX293_00795 [Candidatus Latescibacterota bacterium]|nr:hypothetical protein [Candidatus Latescibacterota bacterium]